MSSKVLRGRVQSVNENTGTPSTPTWAPLTGIGDGALSRVKDQENISIKESKFTLTQGENHDLTLTFQMMNRTDTTAAADVQKIRNAHETDTEIELLLLDQAASTSGARGIRAFWEITQFNENYGLSAPQRIDVEAKPTIGEVLPSYHQVA